MKHVTITPATPRTMADVVDIIDGLGFAPGTVRNIRPELKKTAKVYSAPLARIPADLGAFDRRWGTGRVRTLPTGFSSINEFVKWRKRVRQALARALGAAPATKPKLLPEWSRLIDFCAENGGVGKRLGPKMDITLGILGEHASAAGRTPRDLDPAWLAATAATLTGKQRRTFRRGPDVLSTLVDMAAKLPEIVDILPDAPIAKPAPALNACPLRRAANAPETRGLWAEFDAWVLRRRGRDPHGRPISTEDAKFGEKTVKSYEHNLNTALSMLLADGAIRRGAPIALRDVCNADAIEKAARIWNKRQIKGVVRMDAPTLHTMVCRLGHLAEAHGAGAAELARIATIRERVKEACGRVGKMSARRETWIKTFAKDSARQRALHALPETLMRRADAILARWDELKRKGKKGSNKQRMEALSLGVAACAFAILHRGSPVRAANLRSLRHEGDQAHLLRNGETGVLRLAIPALEVKNRHEIDTECDDDAWPVIAWYLEKIRPKLVAVETKTAPGKTRVVTEHPYGVKLVDSDHLFPSTRPDAAMEETTFAAHCRTGALAAGLDMDLHTARHVTAFLILDANPNAWAEAAAVVGVSVNTLKKHYAWLDDMKACAEGRSILKEQRAASRRHRKGSYAHV
jgi:hypothetical protein